MEENLPESPKELIEQFENLLVSYNFQVPPTASLFHQERKPMKDLLKENFKIGSQKN